jgi:flagellar hook assembly protein FlgD
MKPFLLAAAVLLAAPGIARAEPTTIAMRDIPLGGERTLAAAAAQRFDLVGLHWRGSGSVEFRTRSLAGRWGAWRPAAPEAEDGPDHPVQPGWRIGNPYWVGASDAIAYRLRGSVTRLRAYFVWSPVDGLPPRTLSIAGSPRIIVRASWGADESIRRAPPRYAPVLQYALVHHTAGTNDYTPAESAAIVRGIEVYHVKANGWNDIGYNFLVDKYGQIFEGRYGGVDKNVIGAHAEGFNTGSTGVALLGTYTNAPPPAAAMTALASLLAWRLDIAHVDPLSTLTVSSGGNPRFPFGTPVFLRAISGHRDTGFTDCPGNALYARLSALAAQASSIGLPKLYAPTVQGAPGGPVTFRARLSTALPWTVTVTDAAGNVVNSGAGEGTDVSWTWDASDVAPVRYGWTISAGDSVTPATGFVGTAPVALALKSASAKPAAISGDGSAKQSTIAYTLTAAATVTATLTNASGHALATLFQQPVAAGRHSFTFSADGVADGRYSIELSASAGKTTVTRVVTVLVDRTVTGFTVTPSDFSPNGDGRDDSVAFSLHTNGDVHLHVELKRGAKVVAQVTDGDSAGGDQQIPWDGTIAGRRVPDGTYAAVLSSTTALGTTVQSVPLRIDTLAPRLRAISFRRLEFWTSEAARVRLVVNGRTLARSVLAGVFSFRIGRTVRRASISAEDGAGNISRALRFP